MNQMNCMKKVAALAALVATGMLMSGCHDPNNILDQQAAAKKLPPPTTDQIRQGFARMADKRKQVTDDEIAHAKADPAWAAQVNANHKAAGLPPIGG